MNNFLHYYNVLFLYDMNEKAKRYICKYNKWQQMNKGEASVMYPSVNVKISPTFLLTSTCSHRGYGSQ